MKKLTWKQTIAASMIVGASLYGGLSYAWDPIPGVDIPYDPPNYYSLSSVSWPDSRPSIYTLRDMGIYINQTVFIDDFWKDFIIKDFAQNARGYYDFLDSIYDSENGGYYDGRYDDSRRITVDDKGTTVNYELYKRYLLGTRYYGDDDNISNLEYRFMGKQLNWDSFDVYGMMNYIIDQFDKNPDKFTRYLVQSGPSNVYDPWRDAEQQKTNEKAGEWLKAKIEQYLHQLIEMTPINGSVASNIPIVNRQSSDKVLNAKQVDEIVLARNEGKVYANPENPLGPTADCSSPYASEKERAQWLEQRLNMTSQFIEDSREQAKKDSEMMQELVRLTAQAHGNLEVEQIRNLMWDTFGNQLLRMSRTKAEISNLRQIQQMQQMDQIVQGQQINNGNKLYVYDPANPTQMDQNNYTRPNPIGLLEFKK